MSISLYIKLFLINHARLVPSVAFAFQLKWFEHEHIRRTGAHRSVLHIPGYHSHLPRAQLDVPMPLGLDADLAPIDVEELVLLLVPVPVVLAVEQGHPDDLVVHRCQVHRRPGFPDLLELRLDVYFGYLGGVHWSQLDLSYYSDLYCYCASIRNTSKQT